MIKQFRETSDFPKYPEITATCLIALNKYLETKPINLIELLPEFGINADIDLQPVVMVSLSSVISLYEYIADELEDDSTGVLIGSLVPIGVPGVFEYSALSAPSLETGLLNWARFINIVSNGLTFQIEIEGDICVLDWSFNEDLGPNYQYMDLLLSYTASRIRYIVGDQSLAFTARFQHPVPHQIHTFERLIGEDLRFDQEVYQLSFPSHILSSKPPGSEPSLYSIIEKAALTDIENRENRSDALFLVSEKISSAIKNGKISVKFVAEEMGMSPRSLQRLFDERGTTFSKLTDDIRKSMAQRYLLETEISLNEISFLLGYSEPSVFSRAAKSWFGVSPKDYRKQKL